ncbi:L,D-transpeptidase family protein [Flammeovirga sp. MY04]|uniref:L,D-transpeptidase family protein n=1 Tax=Flammeovirga sp. MY04 TaxID=1191459 RepID=UPI0008062F75|nr:L,D-transpeptidase family protein [Flammeovirga sp. MY04]ANQ50274.1 L,D-transpeptidase family protein [Flammeovirga sp. MY04]
MSKPLSTYSRLYSLSILFLLALSLTSNKLNAQNSVQNEIKNILTTLKEEPQFTVFSDSLMPLMYNRLDYQEIWSDTSNINDLLYCIQEAYHDGLNPEHYHLEIINKLLETHPRSPKEQAQLDILLTDAGILLSSHLIWGKVQPESISTTWNYDSKEFDGDRVELFLEPIQGNLIKEAVEQLKPKNELYVGLKKSLFEFRKIKENGGWHKLPKMENLEIGDENDEIPFLRKRLATTSTLFRYDTTVLKIDTLLRTQTEGVTVVNSPSINPEIDTIRSVIPYSPIPYYDSSWVKVSYLDTLSRVFDENLKNSVIKFQKMYGLVQDGQVGKATQKALNISIDDRINTLRINLERTRWINHEEKDNFIFVNIPSFELYLHKNNSWYYQTKVIIGKPYHQTPVFKAKLSYIDINPTWTVPYSIASKEMLPKLKKDANYLSRNNMKLYDRSNKIVDATTVDWKSIKTNNFPYTIVQGSGPGNALGHVKFIFPNKYSIYLHDTPSRYLFSRNTRAFSHGCIRVYQPVKLASILLEDEKYTEKKINEIIKEGELKRVIIMHRPTVYLMYFTAILGPEESIHFYEDVYSRDKRVLKQLDKKPY